ncbi:MAG: bifunctional indole-3-glycerol phosphate synthase/phosphoribosylanthranilate isomerase [Treponema sp.]|nr:bifunctional indole-3-glycerol phosphate synthase/phosphoribosylanthranilate isomerase [Treponema sp.]
MASNILDEIIEKRKADIQEKGYAFGFEIPLQRTRGRPVPFIAEKGVVLEIKRASPSKGDIAPQLNAADTATAYAEAGTSAISVLTETNYFKGSLQDLITVCKAVDDYANAHPDAKKIAILRKDFLLAAEEIDIAYQCGADAVLLIARILDKDTMLSMASKCEELGITAFIELRLKDDLKKLEFIAKKVSKKYIVCGVNARDLKDFSIDLLTPAGLMSDIQAILGKDARIIFESGVRTPMSADFAGSLGFTGMLLGEAAARKPSEASALVSNFVNASKTEHSQFWLEYSQTLHERTARGIKRPLVKICGLTTADDALAATLVAPDFLGFIFSGKSKRNVSASTVRQVRTILDEHFDQEAEEIPETCEPNFDTDQKPRLVGVITECDSNEGKEAIALVKEGILDIIQLHGQTAAEQFFQRNDIKQIPHYAVVNISTQDDIDKIAELRKKGEPRILIDAKSGNELGGTGKQINAQLVQQVAKKMKLWLAGGINPQNVADVIEAFQPELIDISSGIESAPGIKDYDALLKLDQEISKAK